MQPEDEAMEAVVFLMEIWAIGKVWRRQLYKSEISSCGKQTIRQEDRVELAKCCRLYIEVSLQQRLYVA